MLLRHLSPFHETERRPVQGLLERLPVAFGSRHFHHAMQSELEPSSLPENLFALVEELAWTLLVECRA